MKKIFTKLIGVTLGLAMAVGVGVGVAANSRAATGLDADNSVSWVAADFNGQGAASPGAQMTLQQSGVTVTIAAGNKGDTAYAQSFANSSFTFSGGSNNITGFTITANGTSYNGSQSSGTMSVSPAGGTLTRSSGSTAIVYTGGSSNTVTLSHNKQIRFTQISVTYAAPTGATVESVSLSGAMSTKSYTTVQSFSDAGLNPVATMSDDSDYEGDFTWEYTPSSPAAAVMANSNEEVTGLSVTAKASAGGKQSNGVVTTGISVSCATVAQGLAAIPNLNDRFNGAIVKGKVSYVQEVSVSNHNATYFISDDGSRTNELEVYRGRNLNNTDFNNSNDIKVGDNVLVYGNLQYYDAATDVQEFLAGNYLLDWDRPASPDPSITITENSFSMNVGDDDVTLHETHENIPEGGSIKWVSGTPATATINESTGVVHAVAVGTTEITAKIVDSGDNMVASNSITITVYNITYPVSDGDSFIVKCTHNAHTYYFTEINNSNIGQYSETKSDAAIFTAEEGANSGEFNLKFNGKYLSYSGSENKVYSSETTTDNTLWTIVNDGFVTNIQNVAVSTRIFKFNTTSGQERFCCYSTTTNTSNIDVEIVEAPEVSAVTVAGDSTANAAGGTSVTKEFMYEVSYTNPLNPGTGAVTVNVLNSSDGTDGAEVTSAPNGTSFSVTFSANDTYTVTVTSVENTNKSDSVSIVVSGIYVPAAPVLSDYELYSGASLVEGDYIIYYDGGALNNTISSSRAQYEEVEPANNKISTADASIIWHIAPAEVDGYYTIYNDDAGEYLASTGAKNKAQLLADGTDDKALWSVTINAGTFDFVNKQNTANGVNANLRRNGSYGFACYAEDTGGALTLYRTNIAGYLHSTIPVATYTETANGNYLRLGSAIPVEKWRSIVAIGEITDYGVMIYKTDSQANITSETPVEDAYRNSGVEPATLRKGNGNPPTANDGYYAFAAKMKVSNIDTIFCAASFVVVGGQYYFFAEQQVTARGLGA